MINHPFTKYEFAHDTAFYVSAYLSSKKHQLNLVPQETSKLQSQCPRLELYTLRRCQVDTPVAEKKSTNLRQVFIYKLIYYQRFKLSV